MNCVTSKNLSLKYQRFTLAGTEFNEFELPTAGIKALPQIKF